MDKNKEEIKFRCGLSESKYSKNKIWRKEEQDDVNYEGRQQEKQLQPIEKKLPCSMGGKSSLGLPWLHRSKLKHPLAAGSKNPVNPPVVLTTERSPAVLCCEVPSAE
jgi:hypothetical protein